mgnify:CR=1 FL=1
MEISRLQAKQLKDYLVFEGELISLCKAIEDISSADESVSNAAYQQAVRIADKIKAPIEP